MVAFAALIIVVIFAGPFILAGILAVAAVVLEHWGIWSTVMLTGIAGYLILDGINDYLNANREEEPSKEEEEV